MLAPKYIHPFLIFGFLLLECLRTSNSVYPLSVLGMVELTLKSNFVFGFSAANVVRSLKSVYPISFLDFLFSAWLHELQSRFIQFHVGYFSLLSGHNVQSFFIPFCFWISVVGMVVLTPKSVYAISLLDFCSLKSCSNSKVCLFN